MITDPPSSVYNPLPKACFDQVNILVALEFETEVAVQVRVKLFKGGTSITET